MEKDSSPKLEGLRSEQLVRYAALFLAVNLLLCLLIGLKPEKDLYWQWKGLPNYLKWQSEVKDMKRRSN
jgi:hypothetical protein